MPASSQHPRPLSVIAVTLAVVTGYVAWQGAEKFVVEAMGAIVTFPIFLANQLPGAWSGWVLNAMLRHNVVINVFSLVPLVLIGASLLLAGVSIGRRSRGLAVAAAVIALGLLTLFHFTKERFVTFYAEGADPTAAPAKVVPRFERPTFEWWERAGR